MLLVDVMIVASGSILSVEPWRNCTSWRVANNRFGGYYCSHSVGLLSKKTCWRRAALVFVVACLVLSRLLAMERQERVLRPRCGQAGDGARDAVRGPPAVALYQVRFTS